jgi:hypothetical protein
MKKRRGAEQIVSLLRQADVDLGKGVGAAGVAVDRVTVDARNNGGP